MNSCLQLLFLPDHYPGLCLSCFILVVLLGVVIFWLGIDFIKRIGNNKQIPVTKLASMVIFATILVFLESVVVIILYPIQFNEFLSHIDKIDGNKKKISTECGFDMDDAYTLLAVLITTINSLAYIWIVYIYFVRLQISFNESSFAISKCSYIFYYSMIWIEILLCILMVVMFVVFGTYGLVALIYVLIYIVCVVFSTYQFASKLAKVSKSTHEKHSQFLHKITQYVVLSLVGMFSTLFFIILYLLIMAISDPIVGFFVTIISLPILMIDVIINYISIIFQFNCYNDWYKVVMSCCDHFARSYLSKYRMEVQHKEIVSPTATAASSEVTNITAI